MPIFKKDSPEARKLQDEKMTVTSYSEIKQKINEMVQNLPEPKIIEETILNENEKEQIIKYTVAYAGRREGKKWFRGPNEIEFEVLDDKIDATIQNEDVIEITAWLKKKKVQGSENYVIEKSKIQTVKNVSGNQEYEINK